MVIEVYISKKWLFGVFGVIGALVILLLVGYGVYNTKENRDATEVVRRFVESTERARGRPYQITGGPWIISKSQVERELSQTKRRLSQMEREFFKSKMGAKYIKARIEIDGYSYYFYFVLVKLGGTWKISALTYHII